MMFNGTLTVNADTPTPTYSVEQWKRVDIMLTSSITYTNSDTDVSINGTFAATDGATITLPGFWDGGNTWKVRFAPTKIGLWSYTITCSDTTNTGLYNITGTIECNAYSGDLDIYKHGFIKPSSNERYFVYDDGTPFFWLSDTHWQMPDYESITTCNLDNCGNQFAHVVNDRVAKGFTVYQTYPDSAENDGGGNVRQFSWWSEKYSHLDPAAFRDKFDEMMNYMADHGLVISLGMGVHTLSTQMGATSLDQFTKYMVARYASYPVVWFTGQECDVGPQSSADIWKTAAQTINQYDGYHHPLGAHLNAVGDDTLWGTETWHTWFPLQGGHVGSGIRTQAHYQTYWNYSKTQPFLETEAMYEDVDCGGVSYLADTRHAAWKALQCGSYGYSYGVSGIWAMKRDTDVAGWDDYSVGGPWYLGMNKSGSTQMTYLKNFYTYVGFQNLVPRYNSSTWCAFSDGEASVLSTEGSNTYVVYFYNVTTATGKLKNMDNSKTYIAKWYNPRTGTYSVISDTITLSSGTYMIPTKPNNEDWVLLVTNKDL